MTAREPLPIKANRNSAKRLVRLSIRAYATPAGDTELVELDIYNSIGNYGYGLSMTREETQALVDALQALVWGPPDA